MKDDKRHEKKLGEIVDYSTPDSTHARVYAHTRERKQKTKKKKKVNFDT